jgi:hypothetical protein
MSNADSTLVEKARYYLANTKVRLLTSVGSSLAQDSFSAAILIMALLPKPGEGTRLVVTGP